MNRISAIKSKSMSVRRFFSTSKWDHDVLICGGGVVGAALAAELLMRSKGTCNVGLIELFPPKPTIRAKSDSPDVRVYALSPNSIQVLQHIGAWKHIEERSHPYANMQVWEQSGPGVLKFSAAEMQASELGRICEDQTIQSAIYKSIEDQGHALTTYYGYSIDDLKLPSNAKNPTGAAIVNIKPKDSTLESKQLSARLIVGADGGNSSVRKFSGISTWGWGYGQEAVVATIRIGKEPENLEGTLDEDHDKERIEAAAKVSGRAFINNTAWQKYLHTGPLAVLPLWDNYASIVWSTSVADAKRLKSLSPEQFLVELNAALQTPPETDKWSVHNATDAANFPPFLNGILGAKPFGPVSNLFGKSPLDILKKVKQEVGAVADTLMSAAQMSDPMTYPPVVGQVCGPRVSFPLSFSQASQYTAPRCALIGDAAHSIHPQAGQGLNLGILDAVTLANCIVRTLQVGGDIGNSASLSEYERERYVKNLGMMALVDGINSVFKDAPRAYPYPSSSESPPNQTENTWEVGEDGGVDAKKDRFGTQMKPESLDLGPKVKQFLRSAGMLGIHQLGPVKNRIAKFAMGVDSSSGK